MAVVGGSVRGARFGAGLVAIGGLALLVKGGVRASTGGDPSLIPLFGLATCAGLLLAGLRLRSGPRPRLLTAATVVAGAGLSASLVAVAYLLTGTIPETPGAPTSVGIAYGVLSASLLVSLALLAGPIARRRLLEGRWRWVPLVVLLAQMPIFAAADAIGASLRQPAIADGLGLTLTGIAWCVIAAALTREPAPAV